MSVNIDDDYDPELDSRSGVFKPHKKAAHQQRERPNGRRATRDDRERAAPIKRRSLVVATAEMLFASCSSVYVAAGAR